MDNDNVKSHKSTEETRKKTENNINCNQVRFEKNELNSKLFFENLEKLKWMNSKEAAFYLRISVGQIRNMVWRGQVKYYRLSNRIRFLKFDLDALMKSSNNWRIHD